MVSSDPDGVVADGAHHGKRAALSFLRRWMLVPSVALAITILGWPFIDAPPKTGLDPSWAVALHLATWAQMRHGVDFVMTYGPLGFLGFPTPHLGATSVLALAATIGVFTALFGTLLMEARRALPFWAAVLATLAISRFFIVLPMWESLQLLAFLWSVEAVSRRVPLDARLVVVVAGVLAGGAFLGKLNVATFVLGMGGVAAACAAGRPSWRAVVGYAGVAGATIVTLWLLGGQRIGDLGAYVASSLEVITGYSYAMATDRDPWLYWLYPAFIIVAIAVGYVGWQTTRSWDRWAGIGIAALFAILVFAEWKTAFTRGFPVYALLTLGVAAVSFARPGGQRSLAVTVAIALAFLVIGARLPWRSYLDVPASARSITTQVARSVLPGRSVAAAERTREALRTAYGLSPSILAHLSGRRVHIDPWESAAAFAYPEFSWAPLPVFQSYAAFTSSLDLRNATVLEGATAPDRILRGVTFWNRLPAYVPRQLGRALAPGERLPVTVDGRYRWFEAPAAMLATFCRYREVAADERWQVLALKAPPCLAPEALGTTTALEGEQVRVPAETRTNRFVVVRIHGLEPDLLTRLRTTLWKGPEWFVTVNDLRFRLVASTAANGLLLAVPPEVDGSGPFAFGSPISTLAIQSGLQAGTGRTLTYEFLSVPLAPG